MSEITAILKRHYIETLRVSQRAYFVGYIAAVAFLSITVRTIEDPRQDFLMPVLNQKFNGPPALLIALCIYIAAGFFACFAQLKRSKMEKQLSASLLTALKTFPAVATATTLSRIVFVVVVPVIIFLFAFKQGKSPMGWFDAMMSSVAVSPGFILSLFSFKQRITRRSTGRAKTARR